MTGAGWRSFDFVLLAVGIVLIAAGSLAVWVSIIAWTVTHDF